MCPGSYKCVFFILNSLGFILFNSFRIDSDSFHAQYFNLEKVNLKSDLLYHYIQPNSKDLLYKLFNYDTLEKRMKQVFSSSTLSPRQQLIGRLFQN